MVILLVALLLVGHLLKMLLCKLLLRNAQTLSIALLESSRARLRGLRRCSVAGIVGWGPWARHRRGPWAVELHACHLSSCGIGLH